MFRQKPEEVVWPGFLDIIPSKHIDKAFFMDFDLIVPEDDYKNFFLKEKDPITLDKLIEYLKQYADEKGTILHVQRRTNRSRLG